MNTKQKLQPTRPTSTLREGSGHRSPKRARTSSVEVKKTEHPVDTACAIPETLHSHEHLWKWTLTPDAVAACRVQDVFKMVECKGTKVGIDPDFFWLGRVPCRTVQFYGLVVGVQSYETRTVYSVDDGSGVIDCNLRHSTQLQFGRKSPQKRTKPKSKQAGPATLPDAKDLAPKPIARLGDVVRVVGRVLNRHHTRLVNAEQFQLCKDANVEPRHWLMVAELHESWYHAPDMAPFMIPQRKAAAMDASCSNATQESRDMHRAQTQSPSKSSVASSAPSSPSSVAESTSASSQYSPKSPPRLRHPSRLHTRDLTTNTFRIYLKHYMDNAPPEPLSSVSSDTDDLDEIEELLSRTAKTPVRQRTSRLPRDDSTPRPNASYPRRIPTQSETPRAGPHACHNPDKENEDELGLRGYTLSHLRRVPELALLARRVVEAEAKRRTREERKKVKDDTSTKGKTRASSSTQSSAASYSKAGLFGEKSKESQNGKVKRLFGYAIRQLYEEGSIILWEGAVRRLPLPPIPAPSFASTSQPVKAGLWKLNASLASAGTSSMLSSMSQFEDDDFGDLSDPPPYEEAYLPLTPSYLAGVVERAIRDIIVARRREQAARIKSRSTSGPSALEIGQSLRKRVDGPTPSEIVDFLRRRDERWRRIGEWAVKEALQWASERGRVSTCGDGKWEVYG